MSRSLPFAVLMIVFCASPALRAEEPYISQGFLPLPPDIQIGPMSAVAVDGPDRIYVLHRGEPPLLVLDGQHKLIAGWGKGEFKTPHGLRVDARGDVWVTDNARHVVYRMSREGKITLTLGTLDKGEAIVRATMPPTTAQAMAAAAAAKAAAVAPTGVTPPPPPAETPPAAPPPPPPPPPPPAPEVQP